MHPSTGSINDIALRSEDGDEPLGLNAVTNASASLRYSRQTADDRARAHSSKDADFDAPSEKRHLAMAAKVADPIMANIDSESGDVIDSTSTTTSSEQQGCCSNLRTNKTWDAKTALFRPVYHDGVKNIAVPYSPGDALEAVLDISQYQHERITEVFLRVIWW